jgi:hypothetical protein
MADYTKLSDEEIRLQIAKIAGYRVIKYNGLYYMLEPHKTIQQVTRALELNFYSAISYANEDSAWKFNKRYPEYSINLNDCWLLFRAFGLYWDLYNTLDNEYNCMIVPLNAANITAVAKTPARAMCEAFLVWNESN